MVTLLFHLGALKDRLNKGIMMQLHAIVLAAAGVFLCLCSAAEALHVGIIVMPEFGHFNPMFSIIQTHLRKGDEVTIFAPHFFAAWAREGSYLQLDNDDQRARMTWEVYMEFNHNQYDDHFFADLVQKPAILTLASVETALLTLNRNVSTHLLEYLNTHYETPLNTALVGGGLVSAPLQPRRSLPDIFIADFSVWGGTYVAEVLGKESLIMWPMTLSLPLLMNLQVPFMGTGFSFDMSYLERLANMALYYLAYFHSWRTQGNKNDIRASLGLPPTDHLDFY